MVIVARMASLLSASAGTNEFVVEPLLVQWRGSSDVLLFEAFASI